MMLIQPGPGRAAGSWRLAKKAEKAEEAENAEKLDSEALGGPLSAGSEDGAWDQELAEWLEAMDDVLEERGGEGARELMQKLQSHLSHRGLVLTDAALNTPYKNTIDVREQPRYPGNIELETRIGNIIRWNAVAMVLQAYDSGSGVGGHIATYLSAATMMEVGFNHVFRARERAIRR